MTYTTSKKSDRYSEKVGEDSLSENTIGRYLSNSEMEQFKIDCPVCGFTVNLLEFSRHLREDVEEIRTTYNHAN